MNLKYSLKFSFFILIFLIPQNSYSEPLSSFSSSAELVNSAWDIICSQDIEQSTVSDTIVKNATLAGFKVKDSGNPREIRAKSNDNSNFIIERTDYQNASINFCSILQLSKYSPEQLPAIRGALEKKYDSVILPATETNLKYFGNGQVFYKKISDGEKIQLISLMPPRIKNGKPVWSDFFEIFSLTLDKEPPSHNINYAITDENRKIAEAIYSACISPFVKGKKIDIIALDNLFTLRTQKNEFISYADKNYPASVLINVNEHENNCQILLPETRDSSFPIANYLKVKMLFDENLQIVGARKNVLFKDELLALDLYFSPKNNDNNYISSNIFIKRTLNFQDIKVNFPIEN